MKGSFIITELNLRVTSEELTTYMTLWGNALGYTWYLNINAWEMI